MMIKGIIIASLIVTLIVAAPTVNNARSQAGNINDPDPEHFGMQTRAYEHCARLYGIWVARDYPVGTLVQRCGLPPIVPSSSSCPVESFQAQTNEPDPTGGGGGFSGNDANGGMGSSGNVGSDQYEKPITILPPMTKEEFNKFLEQGARNIAERERMPLSWQAEMINENRPLPIIKFYQIPPYERLVQGLQYASTPIGGLLATLCFGCDEYRRYHAAAIGATLNELFFEGGVKAKVPGFKDYKGDIQRHDDILIKSIREKQTTPFICPPFLK